MVCNRCKIQARKDQLLSRYPDGNFPSADAEPLIEACVICSHGCIGSDGRVRCRTYTAKKTLPKKIDALKTDLDRTAAEFAKLSEQAERRPDVYSFAAAKKSRELEKAKKALATARAALEAANRECAYCSRSSDDNPAHNGNTFYSLDAIPEGLQANSDGETESLDAASSTNRLFTDAIPQPTKSSDKGVTKLPLETEDRLRMEFVNFSCEKLVTKFLACFLMTQKPTGGYYRLSDFAKLRWLWYRDPSGNLHETEFVRFLRDAGYDLVPTKEFQEKQRKSKDLQPGVSKQSVSFRFKQLVRKMPVLAAIAHGQIGRAKGGGAGKKEHFRVQADLFDCRYDTPVDD